MPTPFAKPAAPPIDRTVRSLSGYIRRIKFHNRDNGYVILELASGEIVKGEWEADAELSLLEQWRFFGEWRDDRNEKFPPAFNFNTVALADVVRSPDAVIKYLVSHGGGCVTEAKAKSLNRKFCADTIEVCRDDLDQVMRAGILTEQQAKALQNGLRKAQRFQATRIKLTELFAGRGFGRNVVKHCIAMWKGKAYEVVRRDPFKLLVCDVPSAGFKRCDKLYIDLGGRPDKLRRQFFCGWDALRNLDGDTWCMQGVLIKALAAQFGEGSRWRDVVKLGVRSRWLESRTVNDGKLVLIAEKGKAESERRIATQMQYLLNED